MPTPPAGRGPWPRPACRRHHGILCDSGSPQAGPAAVCRLEEQPQLPLQLFCSPGQPGSPHLQCQGLVTLQGPGSQVLSAGAAGLCWAECVFLPRGSADPGNHLKRHQWKRQRGPASAEPTLRTRVTLGTLPVSRQRPAECLRPGTGLTFTEDTGSLSSCCQVCTQQHLVMSLHRHGLNNSEQLRSNCSVLNTRDVYMMSL